MPDLRTDISTAKESTQAGEAHKEPTAIQSNVPNATNGARKYPMGKLPVTFKLGRKTSTYSEVDRMPFSSLHKRFLSTWCRGGSINAQVHKQEVPCTQLYALHTMPASLFNNHPYISSSKFSPTGMPLLLMQGWLLNNVACMVWSAYHCVHGTSCLCALSASAFIYIIFLEIFLWRLQIVAAL